jgi:hypothetical protein
MSQPVMSSIVLHRLSQYHYSHQMHYSANVSAVQVQAALGKISREELRWVVELVLVDGRRSAVGRESGRLVSSAGEASEPSVRRWAGVVSVDGQVVVSVGVRGSCPPA